MSAVMTSRQTRRRWLALIFVAACLVRTPFVWLVIRTPGFSWRWGGEEFSIAAALADGQGFASPYGAPTGATAQQMPGFPALVALLGSVFGMDHAAVLVLALNTICSSLTAFVLARLGERLVPGRGLIFAWGWALVPLLGFSEVWFLWDTALYMFVLTGLLVWYFEALQEPRRWPWWSAAAGFSLLLNAAHVLVLAALLAFAAVSRRLPTRRIFLQMAIIGAIVAPWVLRNTVIFGTPMVRSNVGYEIYRGLATWPPDPVGAKAMTPGRSAAELERYRALGERAYMSAESEKAYALMLADPGYVAHQAVRRAWVYWTGNVEVARNPWPVPVVIKHALFALPAIGGLFGIIFLWRRGRRDVAIGAAAILLIFAAPYYLTLTLPRYRSPIEPMLVTLTTYAVIHVFGIGESAAASRLTPSSRRG